MFVRSNFEWDRRDRRDRSNVDLDLKVLKVFHVDGMGTDFEELFVLRVLLEVPRVRRTLDCRHERGWNLKYASVEVDDNLTDVRGSPREYGYGQPSTSCARLAFRLEVA